MDQISQASRHQRRPPRLMTGAEAAAGFTVKIFVEENQIAPVWIGREPFIRSVTRAPAFFIREENAGESQVKFLSDLLQVHQPPGARGAFHPQMVAVEMMVSFERLDEQVIERKPNWTAPIRVPAEDA